MSSPSDRTLTGGCYCRRVGYQVDDAFDYALICHCSDCRSAFKPFAGIPRDRLAFTHGADNLMVYGDDLTNNTHCASCGSLLFSVVRDGKWVHVAMGTLIDTPTIRPKAHIFVGSKAPWHQITDDLPQYQEFPE
ncbi:MAG: GFA family protein [Rhodobacterales bacterium]|nr:GFA family protein [Rhodobacterales bacterium]